jgi:hypothetical protein
MSFTAIVVVVGLVRSMTIVPVSSRRVAGSDAGPSGRSRSTVCRLVAPVETSAIWASNWPKLRSMRASAICSSVDCLETGPDDDHRETADRGDGHEYQTASTGMTPRSSVMTKVAGHTSPNYFRHDTSNVRHDSRTSTVGHPTG